jgi:hypothetical protein
MTDTDDTEQFAAALADHDRRLASLTQSIEAADRVSELIRLIVSAPDCETRLAALRKEGREVARARLELVTEHARLADERKAFERERAELDKREQALESGEYRIRTEQELLARPSSPYARLRHFPGGMTAEPDDEPLPPLPRPPEAETELVTERVEGTAHTLSRSVPRPRKSMRRGISP